MEIKFKGSNPDLPCLNYGAALKENRPIEFLQLFGEHCAINYKGCIAQAFWTSPPEFGEQEVEPIMPDPIPNTNVGKAMLAEYTNDKKEWKIETKKIEEHKKAVFALVYAQLSESSRSEIQDDEEWIESFNTRDLLYLIGRIRATHIAHQSGNPGQDMERVRSVWATMRMQPHETSFAFRKRVEDYQLERTSVGLPEIPEDELVIGILNRLDMSRFASLVKDYLDNERRGIAALPELPSTLWKEVKDTQVIRFRGTGHVNLQSMYLTRADEIEDEGRGRGRGRGGRGGRAGRGRGRGRGPPEAASMSAQAADSIKPSEILCWNCGKKGHRKASCPMPMKTVHFADASHDEHIFLTTVANFDPTEQDHLAEAVTEPDTVSVLLSATNQVQGSVIMLDTQASIHLISNPDLLTDIQETMRPVVVQGITGDRVKVSLEGNIQEIGVTAYFGPQMAANILSYHKLQETHRVYYNESDDTFSAVPLMVGPVLTFCCVKGHYILDLQTVLQAFVTTVSHKAAKYSKRQLLSARKAYDFIIRMGFISYKAAAEVIQRGSITDLGFTRADLVNAQDIYGTPAAYQLGQGTQRSATPRDDDPIPLHESVSQELQVDLFFFLGQVFFISISVLLGLIMVTHLGPGNDRRPPGSSRLSTADRHSEKAKSKAGQSLLMHIQLYMAKGFQIKRVTSDGEGSVKAVKAELEALGVELNVLGHGSHTPHAESAIRHVKNKARATVHSLPFSLPSKLVAALIAFVVHTANMVPKVNAIGHLPAHTAFTGRIASFARDAPHPFGTAGFLQRAQGPTSNSAAPRGDYCIWLGTTHNLAGTHRCLNIDTLREITGDTFRPALLTDAAIARLTLLAGQSYVDQPVAPEALLENPAAPYALDPHRGVEEEPESEERPSSEEEFRVDIVAADSMTDEAAAAHSGDNTAADLEMEMMDLPTGNATAAGVDLTAPDESLPNIPSDENDNERAQTQAAELVDLRNTMNNGYNLRTSTQERHVFTALTLKAARQIYGTDLADDACTEELNHCIKQQVWECLDPLYKTKGAIPSKMFLTPKKLPNGQIQRIKGRLVAGGHRQDRSLYQDSEISSPTVALTSVLAMAALAAHSGHHVMTLDHKAAYLNAKMEGPPVEMLLTPEVVDTLCRMDIKHRQYVRKDGKIAVRLKKALYGCVQSAMLWYRELASTLEALGFQKNPYDICSFTRVREGSIDKVLVYVDDLFLTSESQGALDAVADALKSKYGGVTVKRGLEHDFLGIHWDFHIPGEVSLSMEGYVKEIISKYKITKKCSTPATDRLFMSTTDSPLLTSDQRELFHSIVMILHYLAKRIRPDILTAVSYCATRVLSPTLEDEKKLDRILSYLLFTKDRKLLLRVGQDVQLVAYVDSSFGVYEDGKSVTGVVIMLGKATIYVKSGKQKIVTRSSTESELVGISDALSQILWTREFLLAQGLSVGPAIVYQDNLSTIFLANKGRSTSERSRHIKIRYFFVSHYIETKEIEVKYLPTGQMIADILTKPLHGALFATLNRALTGDTTTTNPNPALYNRTF